MAQDPSRRQVLRGAGVGLGAAAIAPVIRLTGGEAGAAPRVTARGDGARSLDFGQGWKFVLVNPAGVTDPTGAYANAPDPGFDDPELAQPGRAARLEHRSPSTSRRPGGGGGFFHGGIGWYRKTFTLPPSMPASGSSIEFDGVYMNSQVWINGHLLGHRPYGYTASHYDITGPSHRRQHPTSSPSSEHNQLPTSRWYSGSGIHRNVHIVVTDPVHIARHGTFVSTPDLQAALAAGYATVHVETDVANDGATAADVTLMVKVTDPRGAVVAQGSSPVSVAAGQTQRGALDLRVANPALWSVARPSLYHLRTDVVLGGGKPAVVDTTTTEFGFRYFAFDPASGFALNGQPMKIQGVDLHATLGPLGAAVSYDALSHQMELMKSMGANALRTAHNPPAPELVQVCQRLGILMMVEAFDCWHTGKVAFDYHLYFDAWSDSDIKEMVNAAKNSPAVVLWSIGNETPDTSSPRGPGIAQRLIADIRSIDTSRPVVMGSDRYRSVPRTGSPQDQILQMLDGLGVNYNTATSMDGLHAKYPGKFLFCSETSSETSTRGVYQEPQLLNTGENYTPGKRGTSSYDNNLASWTMSGEYELKKDRDRVFWQGGFLWSGQDYIGEPTPYDVFPVKASFFGAVDTAGFFKDAYYLFKSQWTAGPMVHIVPMNWTDHTPGEDVAVWVYSNAATVELFLNGASLGAKSFDTKVTTDGRAYLETTEPTGDDDNYPSGSYTSPNGSTGKLHLTWNVPFQPGRLTAVAARNGREVARDEIRTAGAPRALRLTLPDTATGRTISADGRSVSFVTAEVVDSRGVVVPGADNLIHFSVGGPGTLAGVDNGRQENPQSYQAAQVAAWAGKALAIVASARRPGVITLTATSPGLAPARIALRAIEPAQPSPAAIAGAAGRGRRRRPGGCGGARRRRGHGPGGTCRGRELLRCACHRARGHAGRRPGDRMVQLLRQGGDRQPARGQPVTSGRLGVGVVAGPAEVRDGQRELHHERRADPAGDDRGVAVGRPPLRPGAESADHLGDGVRPADHPHLRPGHHHPAQARPDQPLTGHRDRIPPDHRIPGHQLTSRTRAIPTAMAHCCGYSTVGNMCHRLCGVS